MKIWPWSEIAEWRATVAEQMDLIEYWQTACFEAHDEIVQLANELAECEAVGPSHRTGARPKPGTSH